MKKTPFFQNMEIKLVHDFWAMAALLVTQAFLPGVVGVFSQNRSCNSADFNALHGFFIPLHTKTDPWVSNSSSLDCCKLPGISCDSAFSRRVLKLELGSRSLTGVLNDSFAGLVELRTLNLSHNSLGGPLPVSVFHLRNLKVLDLSFNFFNGSVPASISLPSLQALDLSSNFLTGSLDHLFVEHTCELPSLAELSLEDNMLSGELSSGIGNLSNLVQIDISYNMFAGTIPDVFHRLKKLKSFKASSNSFTGGIPNSLSNSGSIASLILRNNSLSGPIDLNCSAMSTLVILNLGSNRFVGSVPPDLPSCHNLEQINLSRNNITGQIPESFRNFPSLTYLSINNSSLSNLSSALGILQHCKNLTILALTKNFQDEKLPSDPNLTFENLQVLIIANCRLTGLVPKWLRGSTQLQLLDLSWNQLDGTIPAWFGTFDLLFYLDLSNNTLSGEIPKSITGLQTLIQVNTSLEEPFVFPMFKKRDDSSKGLQYNKVQSLPPTVALGCNHLSGPIWPEFGNLKSLHILDLKCNNLSGPIPSELSKMKNLEALDLSHNDLRGIIPSSLVALTFLSQFNVAYNQLYGSIPSGGQFQTFPESSFIGNCGDKTSKCRPRQDLPLLLPTKSKRNTSYIIGKAAAIGFGSTFLLSLVLFIGAARRVGNRVGGEVLENGGLVFCVGAGEYVAGAAPVFAAIIDRSFRVLGTKISLFVLSAARYLRVRFLYAEDGAF